jgi:hypothetical protein
MPGRSAQGRFTGAVVRAKCSFYDQRKTVVRWVRVLKLPGKVCDLLNNRSLSRKVRADRSL